MVKVYAGVASLRIRQQLLDGATALWVVAWWLAGRTLYRTVERLRDASGSVEGAGSDLAGRLDSAGAVAGRIPLVGSALGRPLIEAADAGRTLEAAAASAGSTVHTVALWVGLLVALLPGLWLLARYLPGRIRWMQEASAATVLRARDDAGDGDGDLQLFAIRAVATHPLHQLMRATPDPAAALAAGDYEALAALELRRLGLAPPRRASAQAPPS